jgi:hypothetical protein
LQSSSGLKLGVACTVGSNTSTHAAAAVVVYTPGGPVGVG